MDTDKKMIRNEAKLEILKSRPIALSVLIVLIGGNLLSSQKIALFWDLFFNHSQEANFIPNNPC